MPFLQRPLPPGIYLVVLRIPERGRKHEDRSAIATRLSVLNDYHSRGKKRKTRKAMRVGHLTGRYRQAHGDRLDCVYNATYSDGGEKIEWDAAIRLVTGELKATPSGRFSVNDFQGDPEVHIRRMVEDHIEKLPSSSAV